MIGTALFLALGLRLPLVDEASPVVEEPPSIEFGSSRSSSHWVKTTQGARVAVGEGLEWRGVRVHLALTWTLLAVDPKTEQCLWSLPISAFWNRLSFAEVKIDTEHKEWCVELRPSRRATRGQDQIEYRSLASGKVVIPHGSRKPEPGKAVPIRHWTGAHCDIKQSLRFFVSTAEHWAAVRRSLRLDPEPAGFDNIDFEQRILFVQCIGPTSHCRGMSPTSVRQIDNLLRLRLSAHTFQTGLDPLPPKNHPWTILRLPRHDGPIALERNAQSLIGGPPRWTESQRWDSRPKAKDELKALRKPQRDY